jgi:hypothetical protein
MFVETMKLRKKVLAAANLYRSLFALALIGAVVVGLVMLFAPTSRGSRWSSASAEMGIFATIMFALVALYAVAWRWTARSQRWAPLTMFVLFIAGAALNVLAIAAAIASNSAMAGGQIFGNGIGLLFWLGFAGTSWKAAAAIPRYLACPAWCQELVAASKL